MPSTSPGFRRSERNDVVVYSGRDHLIGLGWWIFMALFGGGAAFMVLDPVGPKLTVALIGAAVVLGFAGQLSARFELRLEAAGPRLVYRLLGVPFGRRVLPTAVRARVMGLGDHGDRGSDGRNVAVELYLEGALLDELYLGGRRGSEALSQALDADLRARYGRPGEELGLMAANLPWLLQGVAWAQRRFNVWKPVVHREDGRLRVDFPVAGIDADPREAALWVVAAVGAVLGVAVAFAFELVVTSWIAGAVLVLSLGILAWRGGSSLRLELGAEPGVALVSRRRFGMVTWQRSVSSWGWRLEHAWWCGHPTAIDFRGLDTDDEGVDVSLERLKFGPVHCASAWSWLPELRELIGRAEAGEVAAPDESGSSGRERRRRRDRRR